MLESKTSPTGEYVWCFEIVYEMDDHHFYHQAGTPLHFSLEQASNQFYRACDSLFSWNPNFVAGISCALLSMDYSFYYNDEFVDGISKGLTLEFEDIGNYSIELTKKAPIYQWSEDIQIELLKYNLEYEDYLLSANECEIKLSGMEEGYYVESLRKGHLISITFTNEQ